MGQAEACLSVRMITLQFDRASRSMPVVCCQIVCQWHKNVASYSILLRQINFHEITHDQFWACAFSMIVPLSMQCIKSNTNNQVDLYYTATGTWTQHADIPADTSADTWDIHAVTLRTQTQQTLCMDTEDTTYSLYVFIPLSWDTLHICHICCGCIFPFCKRFLMQRMGFVHLPMTIILRMDCPLAIRFEMICHLF